MAVGLLWRSFRLGPLADTVLIEINAVPRVSIYLAA
jgi:hypothetical protein